MKERKILINSMFKGPNKGSIRTSVTRRIEPETDRDRERREVIRGPYEVKRRPGDLGLSR